MGRLDRLEGSHKIIQGQLSGWDRVKKIVGDINMSLTEDLFASGMGRKPRMHIVTSGWSNPSDKAEQSEEPLRYNRHRQPGHGLPPSQVDQI